jgi:hypothetical protein
MKPSSFVSALNPTFWPPWDEPRSRQIDHLRPRVFFR